MSDKSDLSAASDKKLDGWFYSVYLAPKEILSYNAAV
jgi:hypothetical protein